MTSEPESNPAGAEEELNAYLDGELDADACCRVEERLASDSSYRTQYERLKKAWGMLDGLPRAEVSPAFAATTLEMVAIAAEEDRRLPRIRVGGARGRLLAVAAGVLLATGLGFVAGRALWPDPNRQLLEDLPILESFDAYLAAGNLEFLEGLDHAGVFEDELDAP